MKRLLFDVPRWHLYLHRDARSLPAASEVDGPLRQLEDELYDVLYAGEGTTLPEGERAPARMAQWAEGLHGAFRALPAFERLTRQCRGDADAAAVAVESLLERLQPKLPAAPSLPEAGTNRRVAARASTEALQAVAEAQEWATALGQVAGVGVGKGAAGNGAGAQRLLPRLRRDARLRRVAEMAGRFRRTLAAKRRQRVRHGADEVVDVEQGAALARLVPSELARLKHPRARLGRVVSSTGWRAPRRWAVGRWCCAWTRAAPCPARRTSGPRRWRWPCCTWPRRRSGPDGERHHRLRLLGDGRAGEEGPRLPGAASRSSSKCLANSSWTFWRRSVWYRGS